MGLINFYRKHIPDLHKIAAPLYKATTQKILVWTTPQLRKPFDTLKAK